MDDLLSNIGSAQLWRYMWLLVIIWLIVVWILYVARRHALKDKARLESQDRAASQDTIPGKPGEGE